VLAARLGLDVSTASRNLHTLERRGFVSSRRDARDPRVKLHRLSTQGLDRIRAIHRRGDGAVSDAFAFLSPAEQAAVVRGVSLLSRAVAGAKDPTPAVRRSRQSDNGAIAGVIRTVLEELGQANDETAYDEPTTFRIHDFYEAARGDYLVVVHERRVIGGGGIYPHTRTRCEVKHMYLLSEARGRGRGRRLLAALLRVARRRGFSEVVLETYSGWHAAVKLYEAFGFERCASPRGYRRHTLCDLMFRLRLEKTASASADASRRTRSV
jgi:putative acetyltransferase